MAGETLRSILYPMITYLTIFSPQFGKPRRTGLRRSKWGHEHALLTIGEHGNCIIIGGPWKECIYIKASISLCVFDRSSPCNHRPCDVIPTGSPQIERTKTCGNSGLLSTLPDREHAYWVVYRRSSEHLPAVVGLFAIL
jgi:hypothetical protein